MTDINIPRNLKDCVAEFKHRFPEEEVNKLKNMSPEKMSSTHFGLGLWIRNNWLYPQNSPLKKAFADLGMTIEDEVSEFIVSVIYDSLNGREINEEKLRDYFQSHWLLQHLSERMEPEAVKRLLG